MEGGSYEQVFEKHIWYESGDYTIKAKLRDENGMESDWGYLEITMPKSRPRYSPHLFRLLERYPLLERLIYLIY